MIKYEHLILERINEGVIIAAPSKGPKKVIFEPTTKCNLNCSFCFRNSLREKTGDVKTQQFLRFLDYAEEAKVRTIWFGGWGEPFIHKKIVDFIEEVKNRGFELGINTNGTLLDDDLAMQMIKLNVNNLLISIDASTNEKYKKIRGGSLNKLINILKLIHREKKRKNKLYPIIAFIFTAMKSNINELTGLFRIAESCGVRKIIISNLIPIAEEFHTECLYLNYDNYNEYIEKIRNSAIIESIKTEISVKIPNFKLFTERKCPFLEENSLCITWDGKATPCLNFIHSYDCYVFGVKKRIHQISFGNIYQESLINIWQSYRYTKFRFKVRYFNFPSCTDCRFHLLCDFTSSNEIDCWGNIPSCADCLFSRRIVQCPI